MRGTENAVNTVKEFFLSDMDIYAYCVMFFAALTKFSTSSGASRL